MFLYQIIIFFIITCFFSFYNFNAIKQQKNNTNILAFLCLVLVLIIGFRDPNVDSDFWSYVTIFESVPDIINAYENDFIYSIDMEFGYLVINSLIKTFTNDYRNLFLIFAVLHIGVYFYICKKTEYMIIAFAALISNQFTTEMAQLRQGIVCALMLLSVFSLSEGRNKRFFLILFIASFFHYTALLGIIIYFAKNIRWNIYKSIIVSAVCIIVLQINWIEHFLFLLPEEWVFAERLLRYSNNIYEAVEGNRGIGDFKLIFLLCLFGYLKKYISQKYCQYADLLISMFCIGMLIRFIFHEYIVFSGRLSEPFFASQCMLLPLIFKININKYILFFLLLIFLIGSFIKSLSVDSLILF